MKNSFKETRQDWNFLTALLKNRKRSKSGAGGAVLIAERVVALVIGAGRLKLVRVCKSRKSQELFVLIREIEVVPKIIEFQVDFEIQKPNF